MSLLCRTQTTTNIFWKIWQEKLYVYLYSNCLKIFIGSKSIFFKTINIPVTNVLMIKIRPSYFKIYLLQYVIKSKTLLGVGRAKLYITGYDSYECDRHTSFTDSAIVNSRVGWSKLRFDQKRNHRERWTSQ